DNAREVLEVHLMNDAGVGRHYAEVPEGVLPPPQKGVSLLVARELELGVQLEGIGLPEVVDLYRMIDNQLHRLQRIDLRRVAAQSNDAVAHRGQVDDARHAGEVLQQHARRRERDLARSGALDVPVRERLDVRALHKAAILVTQ